MKKKEIIENYRKFFNDPFLVLIKKIAISNQLATLGWKGL